MGDSNFAGKVKFGTERGTLGAALPGSEKFCAKVENLPATEELVDCTDVVIAVGTNDLKNRQTDPLDLARQFYGKVKSYTSDLPNTRIYVNGVLPTTNSETNARIKEYNRHLDDICNTKPMLTYLDTKVYSDSSGKLMDKFAVQGDEIHVNGAATKLIASRLKNAIRQRHHMPIGKFIPHRTGRGGRLSGHGEDGQQGATSSRGRGGYGGTGWSGSRRNGGRYRGRNYHQAGRGDSRSNTYDMANNDPYGLFQY